MLQSVTKIQLTRWHNIIDCLMKPGVDYNKNDLAKAVGTNRQTLWRDMAHPDFNRLLDEYLEMRMDNDVVAKALSNIFAAVMEGSLPISKWFLEYRVRLQEVSKKHQPGIDPDAIEGEFQEISESAIIQTNGSTGELVDALNTVQRLLGDGE